jgi:hypothetical protein
MRHVELPPQRNNPRQQALIRGTCLRQTETRSPDRALMDKRIEFDRLAVGRNNGESP